MNNIRKFREKYGLSLNQLSKYVGVSYKAIEYWESEKRFIPYKNARMIANFFGVTTDELFNDENGEYEHSKIDKTYHDIQVVKKEVKPKEENIFLTKNKKNKKTVKKTKRVKNISFYLNKIKVNAISDHAHGLSREDVLILLEMIATYRKHEKFREYIPNEARLKFNASLTKKRLVPFVFTNLVFDIVMEQFSDTVKHAVCVCHYIRYKEADEYTQEEYERFLVARDYLMENNSVFLQKIMLYKKTERDRIRLKSIESLANKIELGEDYDWAIWYF